MKCMVIVIAVASLIASAQAHATVFALWVNGKSQKDGRNIYIRSPKTNGPVKDVKSKDIYCNTNNVPVPSAVSVKGGDTVTFEWYHDNPGDNNIDPSHKGPITVYIAPRSTNGEGPVWTKIAHDGYNTVDKKWAIERLHDNDGKHDVKLPPQLSPGEYILRAETIALHEADTDYKANPDRGAQFYPSCSQIEVTAGGNQKPPQKFDFIGGYTRTDPGILFNLYNGFQSYPIPGPDVWTGSGDHEPANTETNVSTTTTSKVTPSNTSTTPQPSTTGDVQNTDPNESTTTTSKVTPSNTAPQPSTAGDVQEYYQCGGKNWKGPSKCAHGLVCYIWNPFYSQCITTPPTSVQPAMSTQAQPTTTTSKVTPINTTPQPSTTGVVPQYYQCGGKNWKGPFKCARGLVCKFENEYYSQCVLRD